MRREWMVVGICAVAALGGAARARQDQKPAGEAGHGIVRFGDLKWTGILKGCDMAPVAGDPSAAGGNFVIRIRCADGAKIPPHWHPTEENVTVLKGAFLVGMGETFDQAKLQTMNPGNFVSVPKEMRHFAMAKGETIVQVHGAGPFQVNWVNPKEVEPPSAPSGLAVKPS